VRAELPPASFGTGPAGRQWGWSSVPKRVVAVTFQSYQAGSGQEPGPRATPSAARRRPKWAAPPPRPPPQFIAPRAAHAMGRARAPRPAGGSTRTSAARLALDSSAACAPGQVQPASRPPRRGRGGRKSGARAPCGELKGLRAREEQATGLDPPGGGGRLSPALGPPRRWRGCKQRGRGGLRARHPHRRACQSSRAARVPGRACRTRRRSLMEGGRRRRSLLALR
jgi:hypothetical protein